MYGRKQFHTASLPRRSDRSSPRSSPEKNVVSSTATTSSCLYPSLKFQENIDDPPPSYGSLVNPCIHPQSSEADTTRVMSCYTPETIPMGVTSLLNRPGLCRAVHEASPGLITLPPLSVIDMIEYTGTGNFEVPGEFHIGLGTLNHHIAFPLVENASADMAIQGGCRQFIALQHDGGGQEKPVVLQPVHVNVRFDSPVVCGGGLKVDLFYRIRKIPV